MLIFIVKDFPEAAAFCEIVLDEKNLWMLNRQVLHVTSTTSFGR